MEKTKVVDSTKSCPASNTKGSNSKEKNKEPVIKEGDVDDCLEMAGGGGGVPSLPSSEGDLEAVGAAEERPTHRASLQPPPLEASEPLATYATLPGAYYASFGEAARRVVSWWTVTEAPSTVASGTAGSNAGTGIGSTANVNTTDAQPVARLVSEEDIMNVEEAAAQPVNPQEMAEKAASRRRSNQVQVFTACTAAIVLLLVLVVVLVLVLPQDKDASPPTALATNTTVAVLSPEEEFRASLPSYTLDSIQNSASPQAKAYQWLLKDPSWKTYSPSRSLQRFALATFYYSTGGQQEQDLVEPTEDPRWAQNQGWLNYSVHECAWAFVPPPNASDLLWLYNEEFMERALDVTEPCDGMAKYKHLWHFGNNLQGTLPPEISLLTSLSNIVLSTNQLHGTLPSQMGLMTQLSELWIFKNELSGTLPVEMTGMTHLSSFLAAYNAFTGTVPTFLASMTQLEYLRLSTNQFTGTIPTELGLLHENLVDLYLMENLLTGTLPTELGQLTKAQFLLLDALALHGTIPSEYGLLPDLKWLLLRSAELTGSIPTELGQLTHLENLALYNNQLTGTIPLELTYLTQMVIVALSMNLLTGTLPGEELSAAWSHLEGISLEGNPELVGSVPDSFCNLSHIWIRGNLMNCSTDLLCGCDCPC